jgi:nucleotide-binding universal stress UspA family protein
MWGERRPASRGRLSLEPPALAVSGRCKPRVLAAGVGDPAGEILEAAKQFEAELIVMGARSLGTVGRLVLGSVSTKVMHESDSDVLIVK